MTHPWVDRLQDFLRRESRALWAGGLDVYETTRRHVQFLEARAGAALWTGLFLFSFLQAPPPAPYPFDPGPAFRRLAAEARMETFLFGLALAALHALVGVLMGIGLRNAWDTAEEFLPVPPRRAWSRRLRWTSTALFLLFLHVGFLLWAIRVHPSLYAPAFHGRGGPLRLFQDWLAAGFLSWFGRLWTVAATAVLATGGAQLLRRACRWFISLPTRTRVADGALGLGTFFLFLGLWGVFRFHRPHNEGPNAVVLAAEGLRAEDVGEKTPALNSLLRRGRGFSACVPTTAQREASLMTLLTGRSPLSHGVRDEFPSGEDVELGPDALPGRLARAGYATAAVSDAGGDLLGRLSDHFDQVRAPDLSVPGILRRDLLRRCVHLLPYLRGRWARRLLPTLRAVPELSDPGLLALEARGVIKQLRFEKRFFLLVHTAGGGNRRGVDRAVKRIQAALEDMGLEDSTWVVLWSPFAQPRPNEGAAGRDAASPSRFEAPLIVAGPSRRPAPRWVKAPVRDIDVAPTLLSALGLLPPETMEGLPLLDLDPETEGFTGRSVYTESGLWFSPDENPLPPPRRLSYGPAAAWLEEDPQVPGRLRVKPAAEDAIFCFRPRLFQTAEGERIVYRPAARQIEYTYQNLAAPIPPGARVDPERFGDVLDQLIQEMHREAGWRPQNDYWIPEAFMRDKE